MERLVEFLRSRSDIKVSTIEKKLGLANATIKLGKGHIVPKHVELIRGYLIKYYGYSENKVEEIKKEDNIPGDAKRVVKVYNVGRIPGFTDGRLRFQDSIGLWRRVEHYGYDKVKDERGKEVMVLRKEWEAQTGEMCEDERGRFYVANNGRKVYVDFKGIKK